MCISLLDSCLCQSFTNLGQGTQALFTGLPKVTLPKIQKHIWITCKAGRHWWRGWLLSHWSAVVGLAVLFGVGEGSTTMSKFTLYPGSLTPKLGFLYKVWSGKKVLKNFDLLMALWRGKTELCLAEGRRFQALLYLSITQGACLETQIPRGQPQRAWRLSSGLGPGICIKNKLCLGYSGTGRAHSEKCGFTELGNSKQDQKASLWIPSPMQKKKVVLTQVTINAKVWLSRPSLVANT